MGLTPAGHSRIAELPVRLSSFPAGRKGLSRDLAQGALLHHRGQQVLRATITGFKIAIGQRWQRFSPQPAQDAPRHTPDESTRNISSKGNSALKMRFASLLAMASLLALAPVAAKANPYLLVEADTGRVIEEKDAGKPWYPASVTKLMTVYVALHAVKSGRMSLDTPITVSNLAASQKPSKMGFQPGTKITLGDALKMLMVKSANDVAVTVAEGVGGSQDGFVEEMNAIAQHLGMSGSHFANPHGLPNPGQITTARDMAVLVRALIYHFPEHESLFRIPAIRMGNTVYRNYNRLIDRYPGADGMKTGFICDSGFNLVATAERGHRRLIAVVFGAYSAVARNEDAALLLEKGFRSPASGFGMFGGMSHTLSSLPNAGGTPISLRNQVCGADRAAAAAENEDERPGARLQGGMLSFGDAGLPASGKELLQELPPSMPPVQVSADTSGVKVAPKPTATASANTKPKVKGQNAAENAKPASKPVAKPATKPQNRSASPASPTPAPPARPAT